MNQTLRSMDTIWWAPVRLRYPGTALCVVLALAGSFLASQYGAPALMLVLLLGFGFASQTSDSKLQPGVEFCSRQVLRAGIALLGARIGVEQLMTVGSLPLLVVVTCVPVTIGAALLLGRWLGLPSMQSLVAGVAVAICGVSAAIAVAAVIPQGKLEDRRLLGVLVGVTALGTLCMLVLPPLFSMLGYSDPQTGLLLGASIHDVAQAAGAGYLVSDTAGDIATLTKLLRVALLAPLVLLLGALLNRNSSGNAEYPWFLLGFVILFGMNSLGWLSEGLRHALTSTSQACLLVTMAALGMRTSLSSLIKQGWRPFALLALLSTLLVITAMTSLATYSL
ncbi:YeiH family protein [Marinobacter sp. 2_MG-2023]|uniref:YeiH family protein n=1 Tax=Marinobacter sp. 2_MG-2023 TaxID=3062679 RepID=UPI0026E28729|nr:putative sulfate exporter family transporter [Marinobacter sp. 2_MG-2023]MDO6443013.1 putative sulfate exporter family transporter [Marinobacter sp. 2_MG-2023]